MRQLAERGEELNFRFDMSVNPDEPKAGKPYPLRGTVSVKFNPFVIDRGERQADYPVFVGVAFKGLRAGFTPDKWSESLKRSISEGLLGNLLKGLLGQIPETKTPPAIPQPQVKAKSRETPLVKVPLHAEGQKFGRVPTPAQRSLFEEPEVKRQADEWGIEVVGIDATKAQENALFALQRLFADTDYQGNRAGKDYDNEIRANPFKFSGTTPILEFTPAQYLEAYGLNRTETPRGWLEFSHAEKSEALQALQDLGNKRFLFYFERKYKKDGEWRSELIKVVAPLIVMSGGALQGLDPGGERGNQRGSAGRERGKETLSHYA